MAIGRDYVFAACVIRWIVFFFLLVLISIIPSPALPAKALPFASIYGWIGF